MPSFQVPVLGSTVRFLSPFPDSLPQLFLRCFPSALAFGLSPSDRLSFVRLSSGSGYSASVSSFPLSSRLRLTVASSVLPFRFRFLAFPRSFRPDLSCRLSRFFVLGFLFVSFRPSLIRSHSCSSGASLLLALPGCPLSFRFLSSASVPLPATQPSVSSFPLSSRLRLTVASSVPPLRFRFLVSPRSFRPGFPCRLSRFFVLGFLFVSFHPSRFRSHSRSTGASLLFRFLSSTSFPGFSACFLLSFVRFSLLLTTQLSVLPFPTSRSPLTAVPPVLLSSSVRPVSMPFFRFRYSASCNSFLRSPSRLTVATSAPQPSPLRVPASSPWLSL